MKKTVLSLLMTVLCVCSMNAYTLYPVPQSIVENGGTVSLSNSINVVMDEGISEKIKNFAFQPIIVAGY